MYIFTICAAIEHRLLFSIFGTEFWDNFLAILPASNILGRNSPPRGTGQNFWKMAPMGRVTEMYIYVG